jgi:hypothetical protein
VPPIARWLTSGSAGSSPICDIPGREFFTRTRPAIIRAQWPCVKNPQPSTSAARIYVRAGRELTVGPKATPLGQDLPPGSPGSGPVPGRVLRTAVPRRGHHAVAPDAVCDGEAVPGGLLLLRVDAGGLRGPGGCPGSATRPLPSPSRSTWCRRSWPSWRRSASSSPGAPRPARRTGQQAIDPGHDRSVTQAQADSGP